MGMSHEYPLEGIRVVDASQGIAGPSAGMMMARYGADVIKVEPKEGDWSRGITAGRDGMTAMAIANNVGKRSIALDLKHREGSELLHNLARGADVFIENFRTGVMQRLGFSYAHVSAYNPEVIYLSVTGFGQRGPMQSQPATDAILQAFTGMMSINRGREDGIPHRLECWPIDVASGQFAFQAVAMALYARRDTGRGRYIDASLLQGAAGLQTVRMIEHVLTGGAPVAGGAFPVATFRTADGSVNVSVLKDHLWPPFCRMIGRPDLAEDPALATGQGRRARGEEIMRVASEAFASNTSDYWCARMREAGILNERVNTYDELFKHPQTDEMKIFTWSEQALVGRVPHPNVPGPVPLQADTPATKVPRIGEHTREILAELGYGEADIRRMLDESVVFESAQRPVA
ncbi:MAG: CoA transferase [Betaproteobacteria bacterium]|nr:MAG: CoA transferase [Betaproteobacteria bacterium]